MKLQYKKYMIFLLGIAILTLGVSMTVKSDIGTGSYDSINFAIADILNTSADSLLTVGEEPVTADSLSFMGAIHDEVTRERINLIRSAIDEIHMLEELLDD